MSRGRGGFSHPVPALAAHRTSAAELPVPAHTATATLARRAAHPSRSPGQVEGADRRAPGLGTAG